MATKKIKKNVGDMHITQKVDWKPGTIGVPIKLNIWNYLFGHWQFWVILFFIVAAVVVGTVASDGKVVNEPTKFVIDEPAEFYLALNSLTQWMNVIILVMGLAVVMGVIYRVMRLK